MFLRPGTTKPLAPKLQALHTSLASIRYEAQAFAQLTTSQWQWTPDRRRWSLAQCLDHLNKTGSLLAPKFESALAQLQASDAHSEGPFHYSLIERGFIRVLSPNPPIKLPVPPMFTPTAVDAVPPTVLMEFLTLQERLLRCVTAANGWDLTRVKVTSPISPSFRPCFGAYLEAAVAHERYHWLQVQALRAHPNFPTG